MRNYKINIKKKTIFQKSWVAERCKTKKTSRKPKKTKKTIFQRSWKWKRLGKRLKILFFFVFFGFSKVFWLFSKGPSPKSFQILFFLVFLFFLFFLRFFDFSLRGPPQRALEYWCYWLIHHLTLYFFGSHFLHCTLHSLLYLYLNLEQLITIHSTIS